MGFRSLLVGYLARCGISMIRQGTIHTAAELATITNVVGSLKACASEKNLLKGIELHTLILKKGLLETSPHVRSSLISMYAKCNALDRAKAVIDELLVRDTASWNALISGYVKGGKRKEAFRCFDEMQGEGCCPNSITFICILKACGDLGAAVFDEEIMEATQEGRQVQEEVIRKGSLHKDDDDEVIRERFLLSKDELVCRIAIGSDKDQCTGDKVIDDYLIKKRFLLSKDDVLLGVAIEMDKGNKGVDAEILRGRIFLSEDVGEDKCPDNKGMDDEVRRERLFHSDNDAMLGIATRTDKDKCIGNKGRQGGLAEGKDITTHKRKCIPDEGTEKMFLVEKDVGVVPEMNVEAMKNIHDGAMQKGFHRKDVNAVLGTGASKGEQTHVESVPRRILVKNDVDAVHSLGTMNIKKGKQLYDEDIQGSGPHGNDVDGVVRSEIVTVRKDEQVLNEAKRYGSSLGKDVDVRLGTAMMAIDRRKQIQDEATRKAFLLEKSVKLKMRGTTSLEGCRIHACDGVIKKEIVVEGDADEVFGITRALNRGKQIHDDIIRKGFLLGGDVDVVLGTAVIAMYAKCGEFADANHVLNGHIGRDVSSWNALIGGYAHHGHDEEAMDCYHLMQREGLYPNSITFLCILNVCCRLAALDHGKRFHDDVICRGILGDNIELGNALIDMYAKCGAIQKAEGVIRELPIRSVVSWTTLIAGYAQQGLSEEAFASFQKMENERISPNHVTFVSLLKSCCGFADAAAKGRMIHHRIVEEDAFRKNLVLGNAVIDMYVNCDALREAARVFEELPVRDRVSWNVLIAGYAEEGHGKEALDYFERMQSEGIFPNGITLTSILKVYGKTGDYDKGRQLHKHFIARNSLAKDVVLATALVDMYANCGALTRAMAVLEEDIRVRDSVCWTALIAGYVKNGMDVQALCCFECMQKEGICPNLVTYACILKACGNIGDLNEGRRAHKDIIEVGFLGEEGEDIVLGNACIGMYSECGAMMEAADVLDELRARDEVSWNTLIAGYVDAGEDGEGIDCFQRMQYEGLYPTTIGLVCILKACGNLERLEKGREIHKEIIAARGEGDVGLVLANALINMYVKCGELEEAERVLEGLGDKDAGSFRSLLAGYAREGRAEDALKCLGSMRNSCVARDAFALACVLRACAGAGSAAEEAAAAKRIHAEILGGKLLGEDRKEGSSGLGAALVEMYARWGMPREAEEALRRLPVRDAGCWCGVIGGYNEVGKSEEAVRCWEEMESEGMGASAAVLLASLGACGRAGAIREGKGIHAGIASKGLIAGKEQRFLGNALVDMYARCGAMAESEAALRELPIRDAAAWNALMGGYARRGRAGRAMDALAAMRAEGIDPSRVTFLHLMRAAGAADARALRSIHASISSIHASISSSGMVEKDGVLGSALVAMYARRGWLGLAEDALRRMPDRSTASWNALVAGYCARGRCERALDCGRRMQDDDGLAPDLVSYICLLKACGGAGRAGTGRKIHAEIVALGLLDAHPAAGNALLGMYASCGLLPAAEKALDSLATPDAASWNALVAGYSEHGDPARALASLRRMQASAVSPDSATFACLLSACRGSRSPSEPPESVFLLAAMLCFKPGIDHRLVRLLGDAGSFGAALDVMRVIPPPQHRRRLLLPAWLALLRSCQRWANHDVGRFAFRNLLSLG